MTVEQKNNLFLELMKNFIEAIKGIESLMIFNRQGLLISKYAKAELLNDGLDVKEREAIFGAFASYIDPMIKKIASEYKIGELGLITIETPDHHLIFIEAGPEAIALVITDYELNVNFIIPYCYLFVEKVAQILEGLFDPKFNTLTIPKLESGSDIDAELMKLAERKDDTEFKIDREKKEKIFKLIILGDHAVGKTTLVTRFVKKKYHADYRPTLGISISTTKYYIQGFKDSIIRFLIYDLAGQEFFKRVRNIFYHQAQAVFIVYDITRRETLEGAVKWYNDVKHELGEIPFVLIGNKVDLVDQRQVSTDEGRNKANELKCFFIETSAKENINVQDTFKILGIGLFFKEIPDSSEPVFIL